ncbi:MAG TPA: mechanosensitive ion channel domain-containing protein [Gemmatimonadaceae bacterium]
MNASLLVALFSGGVAVAALAADIESDSATVAARPDKARASAVVTVFNRPIARLRGAILGMSVEERAKNAADRIRTLLAAPGEHKVTTEQLPQGALIKIDGSVALAITHDDAEQLGEVAEAAKAADAARALERVIAEMKEARDPRALLENAGWAGVATAIWLAALWLLRRIVRGGGRRLLRYADEKGAAMRAAGHEIVARERVIATIRVGVKVGFWALALLFTYQWLGHVLGRFPYTRPWGERFGSFLVDTLGGMLSAVADSIPGLLVAILIFVIAHFASNLLRSFFDGVQSGRLSFTWIDPDTARPTRRLVSIAVWLFAIAMAYPYIPGADTDAFKGVSVLLGLMVSVGASGIIGQAASGLILMYTRTYRPGEYVRVGESEGTVMHLGMFTTRVRTGMGEELTLPNSMVLGAVTRNYSRTVKGVGFVVDAAATIGYDAPWRQVHAMLIEAARRTTGILSDPPPRVFQTALSDFYVEYRLVCQAVPSEPLPRAQIVSGLHANIQDVFNEHGVQIMSPHYLGDPQHSKVVPKAHWYMAPAEPPAER